METTDVKLSDTGSSEHGSDNAGVEKIDSGVCPDEAVKDVLDCGQLQQNVCDVEIEEGQLVPETTVHVRATSNSTVLVASGDSTEILMINEEKSCSEEPVGNGCLTVQNEIGTGTIDDKTITGVKRSCIEGLQSSVHVKYDDLPRDSKRKLQELLKRWSEWHERYCSSSYEMIEALESGEETYFPALHVGLGNKSAVSFWMDNQMRKPEDNNLVVDDDSVPLYDRGFSFGLASVDGASNLEGDLEVADASRCFNCGSYSHALRECPKPRDNIAVNNARKQQKAKRNQNAGFRKDRNAARYYESAVRGKYEGLRPGALDSETRRLLGLGELDPPPWLQRMREIGYPPGYIELEEDDQPSGITIYADGESRREGDHEDGEILETDHAEPKKKKLVDFPGLNAPIPENADKRRWESGVAKFDPFRDPLQDRECEKTDYFGRRRFQDTRNSRDFKNESSSTHASSSRSFAKRPRSPSNLGWSSSDRERERQRESRSAREDSPSFGLYSSFSYPSPSRRHDLDDYPSRSNRDREDRNRHHSRR